MGRRAAAWECLRTRLLHTKPMAHLTAPHLLLLQEQNNQKLSNVTSYESLVQHYKKITINEDTLKGPHKKLAREAKRKGETTIDVPIRNRAKICVSNDFNAQAGCHLITEFTDQDQVAISFTLKLGNYNIDTIACSAYFPGPSENKGSILSDKFKALVNHCKNKKIELIIGIDSNAHHTSWESPYCDSRGDELVNYCILNGLALVNRGETPTFKSRGGINESGTHIDVTLATQMIYDLINDWRVETEYNGSDHNSISFSIDAPNLDPLMTRNKRKTNWKLYAQKLERLSTLDDLSFQMNASELNTASYKFIDILLSAFEESSILVPTHPTRKDDWYTEDLKNMRRTLNKLHNISKKGKPASILAYKEYKKKFEKHRTKAKKLGFKRFTENLDKVKDIARLQKCLENGPKIQMSTLEKADGTFTRNIDESLKTLLSTHFKDCEPVKQTDYDYIPSNRTRTDKEKMDILETVSTEKIIWVLDSFSPYKAPGEDDIFPALLQKAKHKVAPILSKLYSSSLLLGYVPIPWRGTLVSFIPKPRKDNYGSPKSYRPISLMSFILKALEKLVDRRIRNFDMRDNPLSKNQHAYRSGHSTETALHSFLGKVESGMKLKPIGKEKVAGTLVLMADVSGAFDNVKTQFIIDCAKKKGVSEWALDWLKYMLETRQLTPSSAHCDARIKCTCGTPQGSCSGPLQWCLCADSLLESLHKEHIDTVCYADDFACIVSGNRDLASMYGRMNKAAKVIENWCQEAGLDVNPNKTELIMFTRNNYDAKIENLRRLSVKLKGEKLKLVDCVTYLGVKLDKKLNMKEHISHVKAKANKAFWAAAMITGKQFGAAPRVIKYIYNSIVVPRITYGSLFYWHKVSRRKGRNGTNANILDGLQRTASLLMTGAMKTTPQASLNAILGLTPIDDIITISAIESMNRLITSGRWENHNTDDGYRSIDRIASEMNLKHKSDYITPVWFPEKRFKLVSDFINTNQTLRRLKVYVDASSKLGKTGIGCFSHDCDLEISSRIENNMNINLAELKAISICASTLLESGSRDQNFIIFSDSKEAIGLLGQNVITSHIIYECIKNLNRLSNLNTSLEIQWIPKSAHIAQHSRADELARRATDLPEQGTYISSNQLKELCITKKHELNIQNWNKWVTGLDKENKERNVSIKMFDGPGDPRLRCLPSLNKRDMRTLTGLLTGHCTLRQKLVQLKKETNSLCRWCLTGKDETSLHVLMKCPRFLFKRKYHFNKYFLEENDLKQIPLLSLVRFARDTGLQDALCYKPP